MRGFDSRKKTIYSITLIAFVFGFNVFYFKVIMPCRIRTSESLRRLNPGEVTRITVEPTGQVHSINYSLEFTDQTTIDRIVSTLERSEFIYPNHPIENWECQLTFETASQKQVVKLVATENQGWLAYVKAGATLKNEEFSKIEQIIKNSHPHK